MCVNCAPLIKAIDNFLLKADNDLEDELDNEGYVAPKKTVKRINSIEDDIAEALTEETDYVLDEAKKSDDLEAFAKEVWPDVKLNDGLAGKAAAVFTEQLNTLMPTLVSEYIKQTDRDLKLTELSTRTTNWVKSWSNELGQIMQLNSHKEIENILTEGLKEGKGVAEFTRKILDSGIRDEYYKARRVAVTEVLRAHSVAQQEAFMQSPAVEKKMWMHTGAYRNEPRTNHEIMNGQQVPKNEPFELEGIKGEKHYPMYPRDSDLPPEESINCHCICQPVVNEDILGMSLEERQELQQKAIDELNAEEEENNKENSSKTVENPDESGIMNLRTANDIEIKSVSNHLVERCAERGVLADDIKDALISPLHISDAKVDNYGRTSQRFIGKTATVNINPNTGNVVTAWKTGKSSYKKHSKE